MLWAWMTGMGHGSITVVDWSRHFYNRRACPTQSWGDGFTVVMFVSGLESCVISGWEVVHSWRPICGFNRLLPNSPKNTPSFVSQYLLPAKTTADTPRLQTNGRRSFAGLYRPLTSFSSPVRVYYGTAICSRTLTFERPCPVVRPFALLQELLVAQDNLDQGSRVMFSISVNCFIVSQRVFRP